MALSEIEEARVRKAVVAFIERRRPPPHLRAQVDLGFRITGQSVEIHEIRPVWKGAAGEKLEHALAKATYVKTMDCWRVYWQRSDLKWHSYQPAPTASSMDDFLKLVQEDKHACFWGQIDA